jgi:hypothetical protein
MKTDCLKGRNNNIGIITKYYEPLMFFIEMLSTFFIFFLEDEILYVS